MSKLLLIEAYGCGNCGDDAILEAFVARFPNDEITATCGAYGGLKESLGVHTVSCPLCEGLSLSVVLRMIPGVFGILFALLRCDVLVYGGGGIIHDLTPYNLPFMFMWHRLARLFGKKVVYAFVGVGPVSTPRGKRLCGRYLSMADGLYVRDERGERICREVGAQNVVHVHDTAFSYLAKHPLTLANEPQLNAGEYVCVTACAWFRSEDFWKRNQMDLSENMKRLAECLRALHQACGKKLVFVPTVAYDIELGKKLEQLLDGVDFWTIPNRLSYAQAEAIIENSYFVFGMRMHSLIFAMRHSVPVIGVAYDEKVSEILREIGMDEFLLHMDELTPEQVTAKYLLLEQRYSDCVKLLDEGTQRFYNDNEACINAIRTLSAKQ